MIIETIFGICILKSIIKDLENCSENLENFSEELDISEDETDENL